MSSVAASRLLTLSVFDRVVKVSCETAAIFDLLLGGYGSMRHPDGAGADLEYIVSGSEQAGYRITRKDCSAMSAIDDGELMFLFEKDLTIELQRLRSDLYFIHAAALEFAGRAILLVAPSGEGKSTTTWGLLHHGFRYLSDELAPVDLRTMQVHPYAHALCLKSAPPQNCPLPARTLRTARTFHVPTTLLPSQALSRPAPVSALFFLERARDKQTGATLQSISKGEAAARLFAQALNPLAHIDDGLSGAIAIARKTTGYRLCSADLRSSCELISAALSRLSAPPRRDGAAPPVHVLVS